jgi:hypothetical protein
LQIAASIRFALLVAMPFVLDGDSGQVEIETGGTKHVITFRVDRIRQEPVIGPCNRGRA